MNDRKKGYSTLLLPILFIIQALCFIAACNPGYKDANPGDSFRKIYDKSDTSHYVGLDVAQTTDGGYIILGEVDRAPYLLRVDEQGRFLWDTALTLSVDYRDPVPGILVFERENFGVTDYYFVCLDQKKNEKLGCITLLRFSEKDKLLINPSPEKIGVYEEYKYLIPIRTAKIGGDRCLLLAQDIFNVELGLDMVSAKISILGELIGFQYHAFSCNYRKVDNRYHIAASLANQGKCFLQTYSSEEGESGCFMTAVMTAAGRDANKYIAAFPLDDPFIAMEWHGDAGENSTLSGARVEEGLVHYLVNVPIREADSYEGGETLNELDETLPVYIQTAMSGGEEIVFFLGTARSGDIEIYAYKLADRKFWGYMEINGGRERYVAAGLLKTRDGGLAVLSNTNIESRMGRICLFKLSKEEVAAMSVK